jgi:hypothetical protein
MQLMLWKEWSKAFSELRSAFSHQQTFLWATIFCVGLSVRTNLRGVSSIVDCLCLNDQAYGSLLRLCQSKAIDLKQLVRCWVKLCLKIFVPVCVDGYLVIFGDGIKVGKEGKKMPAVKLMHQSSQSNSKAEYIMGHYFQALSLAVTNKDKEVSAVPLLARIHDGIVLSNRTKTTVLNRFGNIIKEVVDAAEIPAIVVADAYYANAATLNEVEKTGGHLVSRVAHNTAAYFPAKELEKRRPGRPAKKGAKVTLKSFFHSYSRSFEDYRYTYQDLYWPPVKRIVRFVIVEHATKGRAILMSTHLNLDPETIIRLYAKRWLIECDFKTAVHEIGTYSYHFWMRDMKPTKRKTKQYLHRESEDYRRQVLKKIDSYHAYVAFGCISQGLMEHLGINHSEIVWRSFKGWLRTIRDDVKPSEILVADALRSTVWNFLRSKIDMPAWAKFMLHRVNPDRTRMAS